MLLWGVLGVRVVAPNTGVAEQTTLLALNVPMEGAASAKRAARSRSRGGL